LLKYCGFEVVPWWLLIFADRIPGFVVVAIGFKVVYEIVGFVRAVGCRRGCGGCW
jgi:hypothetical protein